MIKVGIIGGAGYTAGELIRLLINHPEAEIVFINSASNAGNRVTDVHEGLYGETDLCFTDQLPLDKIDCLFFCTAHGDTRKFMESHDIPENLKIIDLSMDYRLKAEGNGLHLRLARTEPTRHLQSQACGQPRLLCHLHPTGIAALGQAPDAERRHPGECHHRQHRGRRKAGSYQPLQLARQQPERVQGFRAPARARNQTVVEAIAETASTQR